jgi:hypothetical protein
LALFDKVDKCRLTLFEKRLSYVALKLQTNIVLSNSKVLTKAMRTEDVHPAISTFFADRISRPLSTSLFLPFLLPPATAMCSVAAATSDEVPIEADVRVGDLEYGSW